MNGGIQKWKGGRKIDKLMGGQWKGQNMFYGTAELLPRIFFNLNVTCRIKFSSKT